MRTLLSFALLACLAASSSCRGPSTDAAGQPTSQLSYWMSGAFTSAAQAAEDPDYFEVRLIMVRIWEDRADGPWLYVEQAVASALDKPYRQRVYHLVEEPGGVRSDIFELPGDPLDFAGAWRDVSVFGGYEPLNLHLRSGCGVHLRHAGPAVWTGSTNDDHCRTDYNGASYVTTEITLTPDSITSWDRGFDDDGEQVWGAVKGGYVFERMEFPE